MWKKSNVLILFLATLMVIMASHDEHSSLDKYVPILRQVKSVIFNAIEVNVKSKEGQRFLKRNKKIQSVPYNMVFPCDLNITLRSKEVPNSVDKLRPGDIDVVGAIGDSLTAGFGNMATNPLEILHEGRGSVFSMGGEGTWRKYLTLPNILKLYNPKLYGYSLDALSIDRKSKFNVAEGGAVSENMPYMARVLVKRIKNDKNVNLDKDWKMITIFIGHNDFCTANCYTNKFDELLTIHKQDMLEVLTILKDNLPRTIVNLIPPIHMRVFTILENKPAYCQFMHLIACPCMFGLPHIHLRSKMMELMTKWQKLDIEIANYPEFQTDDFTVIQHLFSLNFTIPRLEKDGSDFGYMAADCFHASQRGHAKFANDLWNSLLEPYNEKTASHFKEFERFLCPSDERPFISTKGNMQQ